MNKTLWIAGGLLIAGVALASKRVGFLSGLEGPRDYRLARDSFDHTWESLKRKNVKCHERWFNDLIFAFSDIQRLDENAYSSAEMKAAKDRWEKWALVADKFSSACGMKRNRVNRYLRRNWTPPVFELRSWERS